MTVVTCPGYCCAAFTLPYRTAELIERLESGCVYQGEMLADMVQPISTEVAAERLAEAGSPVTPLDNGAHYTCRHWDPESRLCGIYETRPEMCRRYPKGSHDGECEHGCGLVVG